MGGLTEGLEIEGAKDARVASRRVEIGGDGGGRRPIDAGWSPAKKRAVGIGASVATVLLLTAGVVLMLSQRSVRLPRTADEAVAVLNSAGYERLPEERQRQIANEAARLLQTLEEEQVVALFEDDPDGARQMLRRIFEQRGQEVALKLAYGQEVDFRQMFGEFRNLRGAFGGRGGPGDWQNMSEEEREALREQRAAEREARAQEEIATGNAQQSVLQSQMRQQMGRRFGGRGGGGRRGP